MPRFFIGELGYDHQGEFTELKIAEAAAVELSIDSGTTAISIWDEYEEVVSVVVDGEIFDKRKQ